MPQSLLLRLEQLSPETRRRAGGIVFTLAVQVVFIALLLSMAPDIVKKKIAEMAMFSVSVAPDEKPPTREPVETKASEAPKAAETPPPAPVKAPPKPVEKPVVELPPVEDTTAIETTPPPAPPAPPAPPKRSYGPPDLRPKTGMYADTPRVAGSGPNGEPLYAASWFREPYDDELAGFLSTVQGPGYGTIICQTVAKFRVDSCQIVTEYPQGSGYGRAVLAASWQFLVRPPQKGGNPMVGEWVQITIYRGTKPEDRRSR
ncbi:hypothetical protein [Sandaracinobacteroides hominis]|uniref:hypothetical protein n=1 Tax=Sandaracinobacteroides hominis TaxID=2780086 RepID=UPI0018F677D8|nr:hypothetical protein [Sandaracinobacteroides hominis]